MGKIAMRGKGKGGSIYVEDFAKKGLAPAEP
jgi:hypothetical protein